MFSTTELQIFQNNTQGSTVFIISKPIIGVSIGPTRPGFARSIEQALPPGLMGPSPSGTPFDVEPLLGVHGSATPEYWRRSRRLVRAARLLTCLRAVTGRKATETRDHGYGERKLSKTLLPSINSAQPSTEYGVRKRPSYSNDDCPRGKQITNPSLGRARLVQTGPRAFTGLLLDAWASSLSRREEATAQQAAVCSRMRDCAYTCGFATRGAAASFLRPRSGRKKRNQKGYPVNLRRAAATSWWLLSKKKASAKRLTLKK